MQEPSTLNKLLSNKEHDFRDMRGLYGARNSNRTTASKEEYKKGQHGATEDEILFERLTIQQLNSMPLGTAATELS